MDALSIREAFPRRLRFYMDMYGKSRNDLVRDLGFKYSTIRDWEKGFTVPRMDKVELLAEYFHCNKTDLLEEKPTGEADGLDSELIQLLMDLTPEEAAKTVSFIQGLIAGRG